MNSIAKSRSLTASSEFSAMRLEAQPLGHEGAIDREGGAGQRSRPQRQPIDAAARVEHPLAVALEHLDVGQQMVAEGHGLGDLQVGKPRHHGVRMALGLRDELTLQRAQRGDDAIDLAAQPQPQVGGHLVVARTASVQPLAGVADEIGQSLLDVEMHILELEFPVELASARYPTGSAPSHARSTRDHPWR